MPMKTSPIATTMFSKLMDSIMPPKQSEKEIKDMNDVMTNLNVLNTFGQAWANMQRDSTGIEKAVGQNMFVKYPRMIAGAQGMPGGNPSVHTFKTQKFNVAGMMGKLITGGSARVPQELIRQLMEELPADYSTDQQFGRTMYALTMDAVDRMAGQRGELMTPEDYKKVQNFATAVGKAYLPNGMENGVYNPKKDEVKQYLEFVKSTPKAALPKFSPKVDKVLQLFKMQGGQQEPMNSNTQYLNGGQGEQY
jgi:hypothetical protein